ncbi:MAG: hypothetical protein Q8O26_05935 [Phreatobacter sp.]|uniref:hypothetical protein n=1 Tax=Phreatobacter sp. TaxID=1966341 RepID=UPI0027362407|nr:hypothetical protein [Phreatobacter sp.]MDP2801407.1 hypothetical protein [Phreatobacter sp.]
MPTKRTALTLVLIAFAGLAGGSGPLRAQVGYPPPAPGMAPPSFGNPTQQHFEILRQRDSDRRSFDSFQRSQQRETDRNLETLRRQQRDQQRQRDADRRRGRDADEARTAPGRAVQGGGARRTLTEAERDRINRAATQSRSTGTPSIMIEDSPRRR